MRIKGLAVAAGLVALATACSQAPAPLEPAGRVPAPSALLLGETYSLDGATRTTDVLRLDGTTTMPFLRQAATAPALETYQVSFWATKGQAASVTVRYLGANGQPSTSDRFLTFQIPKSGLASGANGSKLKTGESVYVTLTIDPVNFEVDFQPSGVLFNSRAPATLQYWYHHADEDLNGDGVVNGTDETLLAGLSIWYTPLKGSPWVKVVSANDPVGQTILTDLYHFSGYAIAW